MLPTALDSTTAPGGSNDPSAAPSVPRFRHGMTDGRYTLERELARGGMGQIWVANDVRLSRRVAIKQLLEPSASQVARFDRELALTSRLEHPSIVSLHDAGTWPDGTPFYVMKLVSGEPLDRVIARTTNTAERLTLLPRGLAVVDAIAYAHTKRIVHRDLKPANVIVGEFGETVVIDWGLAKDLAVNGTEPVDRVYRSNVPVDATAGGDVIGTPAYMPPEQALGDAVDERADVYALGAMLDHLLSGAAPYHGVSADEVLASVIKGPPPPLAVRAPGVPADLIAIVEKAMAQRPGDRYANAAELASDLKRFHGGQLVGAHRYTTRQLLWRWLRKHRAVVLVAFAATIALTALGITSLDRIVRARELAELQRGHAEENHAKAERLVSFMLVDLGDKLKPIGKLDLLEGVAVEARNYYQEQTDAQTADEQHRRALALHSLGNVLAKKTEIAAALTQHQAALAIHQRLAASDPKWQTSLVESYLAVGDALCDHGEGDAGLSTYQKAVALAEKLVAASADDQAALEQLAAGYGSLGKFYFEARSEAKTALDDDRRALAVRQHLVALEPTGSKRQRELIASHAEVGKVLMDLGDYATSLTEHREALRLAEALAAREPEDATSLRLVADQDEDVALVLHNQHEFPSALDHYHHALDIYERLAARDPFDRGVKSLVAQEHMNIGKALEDQNQLETARVQYQQALDVVEQQLRIDRSSAPLRSVEARIAGFLGAVLFRQGHRDAGVAAFERSRTITEELATQEPNNQLWQERLGDAYQNLGDAKADGGETAAALELWRKALRIAEGVAAHEPTSTSAQANVVDRLERVAVTLDEQGATDEAAALFPRLVTLADALSKQAPDNPGLAQHAGLLRKQAAACCKHTKR